MLKLLPFFEALGFLSIVIGLFYSSLTVLPSYSFFSMKVFLVKEGEWLLFKGIGESLSYGYFVEVNKNFDPALYSDEKNEEWDAPNYFTYPPGGTSATCQSVDGKIGCTVWNLDNNGDVCPVVQSYTPNPDPNTLIYPSGSSVIGSSRSALEEERNALSDLLRTYLFSPELNATVWLTSGYNFGFDYNYGVEGALVERRSRGTGVWSLKPNLLTEEGEATCVCEDSSGKEYNVATYEMNVIYLDVEGSVSGIKLLDENTVFLKYFTKRTSYNPPGTTVTTCRMVIR